MNFFNNLSITDLAGKLKNKMDIPIYDTDNDGVVDKAKTADTASDPTKLPLDASEAITGELILKNMDAFRMINSNNNRGIFARNDGSNSYILLTDLNDPYGTFNSLRPFTINHATGNVTLGQNVDIQHDLTAKSNATVWGNLTAKTLKGAIARIEPNTLPTGGDKPSAWAALGGIVYTYFTQSNILKNQPSTGWLYSLSDATWTTQIFIHPAGANMAQIWLRNGDGTGTALNDDWGPWFEIDPSVLVSKAGDTISGTLILSKNTDASPTEDKRPALIVGGQPTAAHMEFDANEIIAKKNATEMDFLWLNEQLAVGSNKCVYIGTPTNFGTTQALYNSIIVDSSYNLANAPANVLVFVKE